MGEVFSKMSKKSRQEARTEKEILLIAGQKELWIAEFKSILPTIDNSGINVSILYVAFLAFRSNRVNRIWSSLDNNETDQTKINIFMKKCMPAVRSFLENHEKYYNRIYRKMCTYSKERYYADVGMHIVYIVHSKIMSSTQKVAESTISKITKHASTKNW